MFLSLTVDVTSVQPYRKKETTLVDGPTHTGSEGTHSD